MEKRQLVISIKKLLNSSIDKLDKDGYKAETVYREFNERKNALLDLVNNTTNRREHLALMVILNKVYVNPTTRNSVELLRKEFVKVLAKMPYPSDV